MLVLYFAASIFPKMATMTAMSIGSIASVLVGLFKKHQGYEWTTLPLSPLALLIYLKRYSDHYKRMGGVCMEEMVIDRHCIGVSIVTCVIPIGPLYL